jgi:hypothetical protein
MDITNAEFDAPVGAYVHDSEQCTVGERERSRLFSVLSSMGQDIFEGRYSPSRKGGANDDEEGRVVGRVDGISRDYFRRDGLL